MTAQVVNNSLWMLKEAGSVLDARLNKGFSNLVEPTTFALIDLVVGESTLMPFGDNYGETTTAEVRAARRRVAAPCCAVQGMTHKPARAAM